MQEVLYDEIIEYKLNPKNILYVTGNWKLESDFKKWKPKSKYSDLDDIVVYSFNNERFLDFRNKWDIADLESNKKRRKHFLCYNRTPRGHRLYLLALLHGKGLIPKGFVSCQKVLFGLPGSCWSGKPHCSDCKKIPVYGKINHIENGARMEIIIVSGQHCRRELHKTDRHT